jgi:hypothetical protein
VRICLYETRRWRLWIAPLVARSLVQAVPPPAGGFATAAMLILVPHRTAQRAAAWAVEIICKSGRVRKVFCAPQAFFGAFASRATAASRHARSRDATRHRAAVQSHIVDTTAAMIFRLLIVRKRVPFAKDFDCLEFVQRPL